MRSEKDGIGLLAKLESIFGLYINFATDKKKTIIIKKIIAEFI